MSWGAVIAGAASLLGGGLANQGSQASAREASTVSREEGAKNRDFQERMSNTAHQRQINDLKQAGLNPLLTNTGGASTPAGSAGSGTAAKMDNIVAPAIASAMEAKHMEKDLKQKDAQVKLTEAQVNKTNTENRVLKKGIPASEMKNDVYDLFRPYLDKGKKAFQTNSRFESKDEKNKKAIEQFKKLTGKTPKLNRRP